MTRWDGSTLLIIVSLVESDWIVNRTTRISMGRVFFFIFFIFFGGNVTFCLRSLLRRVVSTARMWEMVSNRFWTSATSVGIEETYSSSCGDRVLRSSQIAFCSVMYFSRSSRNFCSDAGRSDHRVMGVIWDCCLYVFSLFSSWMGSY